MVLGYNELEFCMKGSGYSFLHAADMMYCADNHVRSKSRTRTDVWSARELFKDVLRLFSRFTDENLSSHTVIKTGESGFNVFRLLTKNGTWVWVQANARLVFKAGKPDFIVSRQKALT